VRGLPSKREFTCKNGHLVTVKPLVIYCPSCGEKMWEAGDRFFDHLKIVNLHESERREGYYLFNLSLGGIIVNGFTYNVEKRALLMPRGFGRRTRVVKAYGRFVERIRELVERQIKVPDEGDSFAEAVTQGV
jgi:hypothetical protein